MSLVLRSCNAVAPNYRQFSHTCKWTIELKCSLRNDGRHAAVRARGETFSAPFQAESSDMKEPTGRRFIFSRACSQYRLNIGCAAMLRARVTFISEVATRDETRFMLLARPARIIGRPTHAQRCELAGVRELQPHPYSDCPVTALRRNKCRNFQLCANGRPLQGGWGWLI